MRIILFHNHYNESHLESVKKEMTKRGAPEIRAIWSESYGEWMAVEGCHRIRAAQELGLTPSIKDISAQKTVSIQVDGENVRQSVNKLSEELADTADRRKSIRFED